VDYFRGFMVEVWFMGIFLGFWMLLMGGLSTKIISCIDK
jgi:hypothetical protein